MPAGHFANTGQKLQLAVSVIATIISLFNAIPALRNLDFLSWWPIISLCLLAISGYFLYNEIENGRLKDYTGTVLAPDLLPGGMKLNIRGEAISVSLKLGERRVFGEFTNELSIELRSIDEQAEGGPLAEVQVEGFITDFKRGDLVEELARNRFKIPASKYQQGILYNISFSTTMLRADFIKINHINTYAGEVEITVARCG